jgi:hypothetical protein
VRKRTAIGFNPVRQGYALASRGSGDAACSGDGLDRAPVEPVDPVDKLPKAMDVLTPPAVSQADELDDTVHNPVTLQPVTIP